ncbi:hypothetical protein PV04_07437 [Phialophora macrospora]|uniref:Uncharacterized protein n=1 Tax=Phialophora macrospora TaxID=1851006 RepID=A0A0D2CIT0_9EURO|nr:hypothetical protein PV04_07437 [Phialophora macrospora]
MPHILVHLLRSWRTWFCSHTSSWLCEKIKPTRSRRMRNGRRPNSTSPTGYADDTITFASASLLLKTDGNQPIVLQGTMKIRVWHSTPIVLKNSLHSRLTPTSLARLSKHSDQHKHSIITSVTATLTHFPTNHAIITSNIKS